MTQVKIILDPAEYFDLLSSDKVNVTDANFINDELIEVHYENVDEFIEASGKTNVVIAAFTTAHARLRLRLGNLCIEGGRLGTTHWFLSWRVDG